MSRERAYGRVWLGAMALAAVLGTIWLFAGPSAASDRPVSEKLKKQIGVLEKVVDEVLRDSPNLLIYDSDPTNGVYLEEFGVIFTFQASLVDKDYDWEDAPWFIGNFRIERENGKIIIHHGDEDSDEEKADEDGKAYDDEDVETWIKKKEDHDNRVYTRGKRELVEVLADYGETLTALTDDQWVAIAAFLKNSDFFKENRISHLILKARMRDLRAHSSDRMSYDDLVAKIVEEEY